MKWFYKNSLLSLGTILLCLSRCSSGCFAQQVVPIVPTTNLAILAQNSTSTESQTSPPPSSSNVPAISATSSGGLNDQQQASLR